MPAVDAIGLTGPDYEMVVERGHIRNFARAMQAPLPEFFAGETPIIPATFLVSVPYTWGYALERPRGTVFETIDHDLSVPLHAEEEFIFHGHPPRAGDRLICRASVEDVRTKKSRSSGELTFLVMLTEYRDRTGKVVVEQRSTTVTTSVAPGAGEWTVELPPYDPDYKTLDPVDHFSGIARAGWNDLSEGDGPGRLSLGPLMICDIVRFQGVVGEDNPLHHDITWSHKSGYPNIFGLGTHQASLLASYAAHWLDPVAVRRLHARFRNVYWPGDEMIYDGKVARKYTDPKTGKKCADLALTCTRQNGDTLVEVAMTLEF